MKIKSKIVISNRPTTEKIKLNEYSLIRIPSNYYNKFSEYLLSWDTEDLSRIPTIESEIISSWLSLILRQKTELDSIDLKIKKDINLGQSPFHKSLDYLNLDPDLIFPKDIKTLFNKFISLDNKEIHQFTKACRIYNQSMKISDKYPSFSFFLFVVCIECVSTKSNYLDSFLISKTKKQKTIQIKKLKKLIDKYNKASGLKNSFVNFIKIYSKIWKNDFNNNEIDEFLKNIYQIRSNFTHQGKDITTFLNIVDTLIKGKTIFTTSSNKTIEIPGLNYLSLLVRDSLINYLKKKKNSKKNNIIYLAQELSKAEFIANKKINEGQPVITDMIKHKK